jgi:hypothetical protein
VVANIPKNLSRQDLLLITAAGVAPDIDGLGAVAEIATRNAANPLLWFTEYHHVLHCILFCLLLCLVVFFLAKRKWLTAVLAALAFHVHLLCDVIGAGGPDGYEWPIPYLLPFTKDLQLTWAGQWQLNSWPNIAITIGLMLITFRLAWSRGYSPVILFSPRADAVFIETLRKRFHWPQEMKANAGG